jgi:hypothetical protein
MILVKAVEGAMVMDHRALQAGARRFIGMSQEDVPDPESGKLQTKWVRKEEPVEVLLDGYISKCLRNGSLVEVKKPAGGEGKRATK